MSAPRRRSIASVLLVAMLWLGVGAVISIGVSWGFAIHESRGRIRRIFDGMLPSDILVERNARWPSTPPAGWPSNPQGGSREVGFGWNYVRVQVSDPVDTKWMGWQRWRGWASEETRVGWPLLGMAYWSWTDSHTSPAAAKPVLGPCLSGEWLVQRLDCEALPIVPLWPGFAANTIFYAALAWGLWHLPLALRRRSRRRKGLCTHCAYDRAGIATDAPCPECGCAP